MPQLFICLLCDLEWAFSLSESGSSLDRQEDSLFSRLPASLLCDVPSTLLASRPAGNSASSSFMSPSAEGAVALARLVCTE